MKTSTSSAQGPKKRDRTESPKKHEEEFRSHREWLTSLPHLSNNYQVQLAIMDSGIFWRGMLKGKGLSGGSRRNPKYKLYPLRGLGLVYSLLKKLAEQYVGDDVDEALMDFYRAFEAVAQTARYAGVSQRQIDKVMKSWGEKVESKFESNGPPGWWYDRSGPEDRSLPLYSRLASSLLYYLEDPSTIPTARIAWWVNTILTAIGEEPIPDRTLRDYISKNRADWEKYERPLFGIGTFF